MADEFAGSGAHPVSRAERLDGWLQGVARAYQVVVFPLARELAGRTLGGFRTSSMLDAAAPGRYCLLLLLPRL